MKDRLTRFVAAVEASLTAENWYAALPLGLALPDMCAYLEHGWAQHDRHVAWFDRFMSHRYRGTIGPDCEAVEYLNGDDFYALRCSVLHQASDNIAGQRARRILNDFRFRFPVDGMSVHKIYAEYTSGRRSLQLQVDYFCRDICDGVRHWQAQILANSADAQARMSDVLEILPTTASF